MTVKLIKTAGDVSARVRVPGSKSLTNRALVCAALAQGESTILRASDSNDTALLSNGLNQLGVLVRKNADSLVVSGTGGRLFAPKFPIPVDNAGTTLRVLMALASLASGRTAFEGDMRMAGRPINDLLDALGQLGIEARAQGTRYSVEGGKIQGGMVTLNADKSSQFLSSLLMVAPYAGNDVRIEVEGSVSSIPYIDMTIDVMSQYGVHVQCLERERFDVRAGQRYKPVEFRVDPDASGASYFFAAAAITGGEVVVEDLTMDSKQGDIGFLNLLTSMGCTVTENDGGLRVRGTGKLTGILVDMNGMPDLVPTLAVTALFAHGPTRIRNVAHLRYKESDRLAALAVELKKLGADIVLMEDGLSINPTQLHGAQLDTYGDHRLAMSFALAGMKVQGVGIENPECVGKSFPGFWEEFEKLLTMG